MRNWGVTQKRGQQKRVPKSCENDFLNHLLRSIHPGKQWHKACNRSCLTLPSGGCNDRLCSGICSSNLIFKIAQSKKIGTAFRRPADSNLLFTCSNAAAGIKGVRNNILPAQQPTRASVTETQKQSALNTVALKYLAATIYCDHQSSKQLPVAATSSVPLICELLSTRCTSA